LARHATIYGNADQLGAARMSARTGSESPDGNARPLLTDVEIARRLEEIARPWRSMLVAADRTADDLQQLADMMPGAKP
jgi:hypothetical protein